MKWRAWLLSSWDDSKQVYRIGKELWDELRIDEADEVPVDALLRLPYGCIFIERRWVDEYEQLLTDDMADTWVRRVLCDALLRGMFLLG